MKSQPPKSKKHGNQLNKTCLLSDAMNNIDQISQKRGKSLNKTGMIVINENEDIVDGLSDDPAVFFKKKHQLQEFNFNDNQDSQDEDYYEPKSKTANVADFLKEMRQHQKAKEQQPNSKANFDFTYDFTKNKKYSFFSQSKLKFYINRHFFHHSKLNLNNSLSLDNIDEALKNQDDYEYDEEVDGNMIPYDEREQKLLLQ